MSRLGQINRVKYNFDKRALIIIINALVFSKLFYCFSVWSNTTQSNLDKLQAVQNIAGHILSSDNNFTFVLPLWFLSAWRDALLSIWHLSSSEDPPYRQGIQEILNSWTFHSSAQLAAKGPFNIERPLCGVSCNMRSNLVHLWRLSSVCSGKSSLMTALFRFLSFILSCT